MSPQDFDTWLLDAHRRPLVMGVLNVTPDSFSDGGQFDVVDSAVAHAKCMVAAGADLIDVGGESTKPGATRVAVAEQIARVVPVLEACRKLPTTFSIDTTRVAVAAAALDAGATIVNDISAGRDDADMARLVAERQCPVIVMHMLGQPATMQDDPHYDDVAIDVRAFLNDRATAFEAAGVASHRILVDPGIGFGKTLDHNLDLLANTDQFVVDGRPVVIGVSRKGFIGRLTDKADPADRIFGTAAAVAAAILRGASIVRVHDVSEMKDVVAVAAALRGRQV